jgi:cytosine/adenosine deaminase-related metal-dependent hydrolase
MLSAAERLLQPDPIPNLADHLATLALEEVGKETPRDDDTPMASPADARGLTPSRSGGLAAGQLADIVVIDTDDPALAGRSDDAALDAWIFAAGRPYATSSPPAARWSPMVGTVMASASAHATPRSSTACCKAHRPLRGSLGVQVDV